MYSVEDTRDIKTSSIRIEAEMFARCHRQELYTARGIAYQISDNTIRTIKELNLLQYRLIHTSSISITIYMFLAV